MDKERIEIALGLIAEDARQKAIEMVFKESRSSSLAISSQNCLSVAGRIRSWATF